MKYRLFLIILISSLVGGCSGYIPGQKTYWDWQVDKFCSRDGVTIIYEQVEIKKADFPNIKLTSKGYLIAPLERFATPNDPFFIRYDQTEYIKEGYLSVTRSKQYFIRNADKKILSSLVSYWRSGGDLLVIDIPSSYNCKNWGEELHKFAGTVIVK